MKINKKGYSLLAISLVIVYVGSIFSIHITKTTSNDSDLIGVRSGAAPNDRGVNAHTSDSSSAPEEPLLVNGSASTQTKSTENGTLITTDQPVAVKQYAAQNNLSLINETPTPEGKTILAFEESINNQKLVHLTETFTNTTTSKNHIYRALYAFTNQDINYSSQWNIPKIAAPAAWGITTGSSDVTIAVIDTGVLSNQTINGTSYTQPDFPSSKMWRNSSEMGSAAAEGATPNCTSRGLPMDKQCNNIDDDGNGKIDDHQGWDFMGGFNGSSANCPNYTSGAVESVYIAEDNDAQPYSCDSPYVYSALNKTHYNGTCDFGYSACYIGHGTMVGSTATSASNNGQLIAGVDHNAKVMNLRVIDGYGYTTTDRVAAAVRYAGENGADVINMSLAVSDCSTDFVDPVLENAMIAAKAAGSVIVAASGNESIGNVCYPASSENAIAVGASDQNDNRASFSNYGTTLDVVAPGVGIPVANAPSNSINSLYYAGANGTSLATPHVAGLAGLIKAIKPAASPDEIQRLIVERADVVPGMNGSVFTSQYGYGRINLFTSTKVAEGTHRPIYQLINTSNNCRLFTSNVAERNIANLKQGYRYQVINHWEERDASSTYQSHSTTNTC